MLCENVTVKYGVPHPPLAPVAFPAGARLCEGWFDATNSREASDLIQEERRNRIEMTLRCQVLSRELAGYSRGLKVLLQGVRASHRRVNDSLRCELVDTNGSSRASVLVESGQLLDKLGRQIQEMQERVQGQLIGLLKAWLSTLRMGALPEEYRDVFASQITAEFDAEIKWLGTSQFMREVWGIESLGVSGLAVPSEGYGPWWLQLTSSPPEPLDYRPGSIECWRARYRQYNRSNRASGKRTHTGRDVEQLAERCDSTVSKMAHDATLSACLKSILSETLLSKLTKEDIAFLELKVLGLSNVEIGRVLYPTKSPAARAYKACLELQKLREKIGPRL